MIVVSQPRFLECEIPLAQDMTEAIGGVVSCRGVSGRKSGHEVLKINSNNSDIVYCLKLIIETY